jgi:ligand-binding SRPBCC domain-containing protein
MARTRHLVVQAKEMNDKAAMFELKKQGLRAVMNAFWDVQFSDPFRALSWDRMHNYAHGLGGKHLWPILQQYINAQGRSKAQLVDDQYEFSL